MSRARVLMIDDSEDDAELLGVVFAQADLGFEFSYALDADQALARLAAPAHGIRLVLLDIKMAGRSGKDVLAEIRRTPATRHLPVILLSSSDAPADVTESYRLGANAYVQKPSSLEGCRTFVKRLAEFWLETATLP